MFDDKAWIRRGPLRLTPGLPMRVGGANRGVMIRFALLLVAVTATPALADERRFMLSGFERIRVEGPFEVEVTTGTSASAVASGDARALDSVNIRVDGRTLVVAPGVNGWGGYPGTARGVARVRVSTPVLRGVVVIGGATVKIDRMAGQRVDVALSGSGSLSVATIAADRLDAALIGTGSVTLAGSALQARFQSNGAGAFAADALLARALTVNSQSAGDSRFSARDTATISATGRGAVRVSGSPSCIVNGTAPVECGELPPG